MKTVYLFLIDGFEEIEALATVDILRRAGLPVKTVSLTGVEGVMGAHRMEVKADVLFEEQTFEDAEMFVIPGGTKKYFGHKGLRDAVQVMADAGKPLAAICAAPAVYGDMGLLRGKKATCYPGFEEYMDGAELTGAPVEKDGNFITGKGPAAALPFAYAIVEELCGKEKADEVKKMMLYEK